MAGEAELPRFAGRQPDFDTVLKYSQTVRGIFSRYTNRVQPFGVDEAWLDVSGPRVQIADGFHIANHLRHAVREETGLTISVGVGDNRIFAKLGSDLKKPDAVTVVYAGNRTTVLDPLPVNELLFIGRATTRKLHNIGIYTVGQLAAADPAALKALFGKTGLMLSGFARGDDAAAVIAEDSPVKMKSVGNSITTAPRCGNGLRCAHHAVRPVRQRGFADAQAQRAGARGAGEYPQRQNA